MSDSLDLFLYVTHRQYKKAGTSSEAAIGASTKAGFWRSEVLRALSWRPMTPDEIAGQLKADILTIRPRCSELMKAGQIEVTGERRPTPRGRNADVLRLAIFSAGEA